MGWGAPCTPQVRSKGVVSMELTDGPSTQEELAQVRREVRMADSPEAVHLAVEKARALAELAGFGGGGRVNTEGQ